jgi:MFS family permease
MEHPEDIAKPGHTGTDGTRSLRGLRSTTPPYRLRVVSLDYSRALSYVTDYLGVAPIANFSNQTQYLDGARGIAGWRWLFIIEGVASCAGALVITWFMPDYPSTSEWLTPEERLGNTQGGHERIGEWEAVKLVIKDWRTWLLSLLYALSTGAQTIQYFVPTIVGALGWSSWVGQCE